MGPIWGRQDPSGPHVGPMNFVIWEPFHGSQISSPIGWLHSRPLGYYGLLVNSIGAPPYVWNSMKKVSDKICLSLVFFSYSDIFGILEIFVSEPVNWYYTAILYCNMMLTNAMVNPLRPSDAYMRRKFNYHCFRLWLGADQWRRLSEPMLEYC